MCCAKGEDSAIAEKDFFSSDVGLTEVLARKGAERSGYKLDKLAG
jgi:hypothetical protein